MRLLTVLILAFARAPATNLAPSVLPTAYRVVSTSHENNGGLVPQIVRLDSTELEASVNGIMDAILSNPMYIGIGLLIAMVVAKVLFSNRAN